MAVTPPISEHGMQEALACVHCGLCTQHCPTYLLTGRESASPRGRLWTMRALGEGRLTPTPAVLADLDNCLVCRACESVCPSQVRYGQVISSVRGATRRRGLMRRIAFRILASRRMLRGLAVLLRFWQRSPLRPLVRLMPQRLQRMEALLPQVPPLPAPLPALSPALGARRGRVALLEGCVMGVLYAEVHRATISLLQHAGYEVCVPAGQGCCGALHEHDGDPRGASELLRRNAQAFGAEPFDALIMNSSGCGAMFRDAEHQIGAAGRVLSERSVDALRFLLEHGESLRFRPFAGRVTWDAPCHLHHAQQETTAPLDLLRRVPGLDLVPMRDAALCCGAAGIYNIDQPAMSESILEGKLDCLAETGATLLLTSNPGCLLQWQRGIAARGLKITVQHPLQFLAELL